MGQFKTIRENWGKIFRQKMSGRHGVAETEAKLATQTTDENGENILDYYFAISWSPEQRNISFTCCVHDKVNF